MTNKKEIIAGIIIIGNEILSGRTKDLNTSKLAKWLNSIGIKVIETRTIPDIEEKIISTINELKEKFDYVFTTGGIGPTHDDITSESVSKAFNLKYEIHKEAYKILEKYYGTDEFNEGRQRMSWMPSKANLILNPASGAPGFYVENVFCLPGVPSILESMLINLNNKLIGGEPILSKTISLTTLESEIAKPLKHVQEKNSEVDIGSYPFFRKGKIGVSIVITSREQSKIDKCNSQILELIKEKKIEIVERD
jgi:molybdenum cofactor synthesis domain-containing protein